MAKKLCIALEDLRQAFDDRSGEYSWILDTETGEVLLLAEDSELPLSIEEIEEDQTGRFLGIDPEDPQEGYRDMEEFIATVADSRLRQLLDVAIAGKGAKLLARLGHAPANDPGPSSTQLGDWASRRSV